MKNVYNNILECVGNTPLVRLNSLTKGLKCTAYAKVEFFNPAGSIKDRVAKQIIEDGVALIENTRAIVDDNVSLTHILNILNHV